MIIEDFVIKLFPDDLNQILDEIFAQSLTKISQEQLHAETRSMARVFIDIINKTRATEYYNRYTHRLIRFVETVYKRQNSSINEMIQHGITVYKDFEMDSNLLETYNNGSLKWIKDLMVKCGVISAEQPVQVHTRKVTDAKKREYAFHKIDLTEEEIDSRNGQEKTCRKQRKCFAKRICQKSGYQAKS